MRPQVDINWAHSILSEYYSIEGEVEELPSERDRNFKVKSYSGKFVLKVSNKDEKDKIQFQNNVLSDLKLKVPKPIEGKNSINLFELDGLVFRLLSYTEGKVMAKVSKIEIIEHFAIYLAKLDKELKEINYQYKDKYMQWDLKNAEDIVNKYKHNTANVKLLDYFLELYLASKYDILELPEQLIHNDANDFNVIVGDTISVIDFGDMLYSHRINELAIACAYIILDKSDPVNLIVRFAKAYHSVNPLISDEINALFVLICMRLAMSVSISSHQSRLDPDNEYLLISSKPAWRTLKKLRDIDPEYVSFALKIACEFKLELNYPEKEKILLPIKNMNKFTILDLGISSLDTIDNKINCIAKHAETRYSYIIDDNKILTENGYEWKNTHMGIDIFCSANTIVYSAIDGEIIRYGENSLLIRHSLGYSIYCRNITHQLRSGDKVEAGKKIGHTVGEFLHFQVLLTVLDDIKCVVRYDDEVHRAINMDPLDFLKIPYDKIDLDFDRILMERKRLMGPSLSIAYDDHLIILRGYMQYLFDHRGRRYLDAVNNVPHVGHSNPAVVRAFKQMQILNTNTRYLHPAILRYSKKLLNKLPESLSVCFFANSGSEANELAIRLARTYTKRDDIIVLDCAYHGNTNYLIDISPYKYNGKGGGGKKAHVHTVPTPDVYRGPHRDGSVYAEYIRSVTDNHKVAAFIFESMPGVGGQIVFPDNYLKPAFKYVRDNGGVCIADEVQIGFGRSGAHFWGFEQQDVVPDIVVLGKPIGNGHPMSAVVCTKEIADAFNNGMEYFTTTGGNPVSAEIGIAVLDEIETRKLQSHAKNIGDYLIEQLRKLEHEIIGDIRGMGLFIGIELVIDKNTKIPAVDEANYITNRMRDHGILISTDGPLHNVLKIKPPMVFDKDNVDYFVETLAKILLEL